MIAHLGLQRKECGKNRLYHLRIDVSTVKDIMNAIKQQFMSSTNHVFYIRDTVIPVTRAQGSVVPERPTQRCSPRFRPRGRFCAKVQMPVVTDRQGGRDKSAPRPYVTDPFHPLNSFHI